MRVEDWPYDSRGGTESRAPWGQMATQFGTGSGWVRELKKEEHGLRFSDVDSVILRCTEHVEIKCKADESSGIGSNY